MVDNNEHLKDVALRIRNAREILGLSEEIMAQNTDITADEYKAYENGEKDFDFTFIYKCAKCLNLDPTDLLKGASPTLTSYEVTRRGGGLPITRKEGYEYKNLASMFKNKTSEPYHVIIPYLENAGEGEASSHKGQEFDIVVKGRLKMTVGSNTEILEAGDTIYYNSATPHRMVAMDGNDVEIYAIVMKDVDALGDNTAYDDMPYKNFQTDADVYSKFINTVEDKEGRLVDISFHNAEEFNFAFDCIDVLAEKCPDKLAMLFISHDKQEKRFTFRDISRYSSMTANYFESLGIKKGDRVMLVLKRHYQFWFSILALHKIGAVVIPATHLLVEHDFDYRFQSAGVSAIVCTADTDVSHQVDLAEKNYQKITKILVGGQRDGWHNFNEEMPAFSDTYERKPDSACGSDPLLMFFTSGTTGYPKIATHNHKYPLGHFITAKYWHNVNPDGIHFTISDTGWGKALWGKLYGQWLCEAAIFVYDFDKFQADDILPMFKKYNITTFCAPPTMYRFFIKEDLSQYDLSSLEYTTTAGEALNPEVYEQWKKATGLRLMEGFGQTETTLTVGTLRGMVAKPGSMGRPSPLYDVDVVLDDGTSAGVGETGEVVVRTDKNEPCGLFMGYYGDEENTKKAWHDGLYHTGDLAWRDEDGYLWFVGRIDDVIKSSGYRIGPFEIESVIMELPYVLECAVTAVPDEIRGQIVKASIVLTKNTQGSDALKKEIQDYVKTHTAPYKYPRVVEFLEELPKTISGKIRRVELRETK
ncbi:AMP-binding protein [Congzhengia minquanensis]|uniref:AMP-binding protein n=1 Tax=Congzhengia minquanensis TaxID=2763657 RepID=A0A926DN12_9FIRM|nr:AMP-binding protein [Congzhengia minquanensis]MBC8540684.1 AMP-binding protein [Congzhengia minquanensis]